MTNQEIKNSTIEAYNTKDYLAGEINIPKPRNTFFKDPIQLNQALIDKYGCGYVASIGSIADLLNLDLKEANEWIEKAFEIKDNYGYIDGVGMYMYRAVDLVRYLANEKTKYNITSYRVKTGGKKFYNILDKGYSILTGYKGDKKYNEDKNDGVLDGVDFEADYGHMIRLVEKKGKIHLIDNYKKAQYDIKDIEKEKIENKNIYEIKNLDKLVENGVFFENSYIYIIKNDIMSQLEKDIAEVKYALDNDITNNEQLLEDVKNGDYNVSVQMALMNARVHKDLSNKLQQILKAIQKNLS